MTPLDWLPGEDHDGTDVDRFSRLELAVICLPFVLVAGVAVLAWWATR